MLVQKLNGPDFKMKFFEDLKEGFLEVFSGNAKEENAYNLSGKVPLKRALPIGVQHLLAMFVANVTPLIMLFAALGITDADLASKATVGALFIAGMSTVLQLLVGARLPVVMGASFTFLGALIAIGLSAGGGEKGYYTVLGAVLVGGGISSVFALLNKFWGKAIKPIVSCVVVFALGLNLLKSGATQFLGGSVVLEGLSKNGDTKVPYVLRLFNCVVGNVAVMRFMADFRKRNA